MATDPHGGSLPSAALGPAIGELGTGRDLRDAEPAAVRRMIRKQKITGATTGMCMDFQQANLVVVPAAHADDFTVFCDYNPRPCPLLERIEPGSPHPPTAARGADLRTDLPRYRVFEAGAVAAAPFEVVDAWRDDATAFLLGCSLGFERALLRAGIPLRHLEAGARLPMYVTSRQCTPAGSFSGPLVVSLRPVPKRLVAAAADATAALPWCHGAPIHAGDPAAIGIRDLQRPEFGDPPAFAEGDEPVFWACGVTPQLALASAGLPYAITHFPGHMLITDLPVDQDPRGP